MTRSPKSSVVRARPRRADHLDEFGRTRHGADRTAKHRQDGRDERRRASWSSASVALEDRGARRKANDRPRWSVDRHTGLSWFCRMGPGYPSRPASSAWVSAPWSTTRPAPTSPSRAEPARTVGGDRYPCLGRHGTSDGIEITGRADLIAILLGDRRAWPTPSITAAPRRYSCAKATAQIVARTRFTSQCNDEARPVCAANTARIRSTKTPRTVSTTIIFSRSNLKKVSAYVPLASSRMTTHLMPFLASFRVR